MGAHQKANVSLLYQLQVAAPQQALHTDFEKSQAGLLLNSGASSAGVVVCSHVQRRPTGRVAKQRRGVLLSLCW